MSSERVKCGIDVTYNAEADSGLQNLAVYYPCRLFEKHPKG